MFRKAYLKHKTPDTNNLLMRRWHFCVIFDVTTMMARKNQAALAVCAQTKVIFPFKGRGKTGITASEIEQAEEFNGQFTDVFNKSDHNEVPFLSRSAPFMDDIVVINEGVTKQLKVWTLPKLMSFTLESKRSLQLNWAHVFPHLFQTSLNTGEIPKEWSLANIGPLYKKGNRALACNYRPVSLTCVPCKLLEHIVCSNILEMLDELLSRSKS